VEAAGGADAQSQREPAASCVGEHGWWVFLEMSAGTSRGPLEDQQCVNHASPSVHNRALLRYGMIARQLVEILFVCLFVCLFVDNAMCVNHASLSVHNRALLQYGMIARQLVEYLFACLFVLF
jgi:hypothetical protein